MARDDFGQSAGDEVVDEAVEPVGVDRPEEPVVHLHADRLVASGEALCLLQGESPVMTRLAGAHIEPALGMSKDVVRAGKHAGDIGAHGDYIAADGLEMQHVVEAGRSPHLSWRATDELGDVLHRRSREVSVLGLGEVAQRDES